ncbi:MAG: hypothetical protein K0S33_496 [Bacteroidetes bacterium]|jgi:hypothetical protein|nr:hypothetical protein [Bacteroidota bacterium]
MKYLLYIFLLPFLLLFFLSMKQEEIIVVRASIDEYLGLKLKNHESCGREPVFKKQPDGSFLFGAPLHVDEKIIGPGGISENAGNTVREAFGFSVVKGVEVSSVYLKKIKCYGLLVSETEGVSFFGYFTEMRAQEGICRNRIQGSFAAKGWILL